MVGITILFVETANPQLTCQYTVVLMEGNVERWMNRLEVQESAPNTFLGFEKLFFN